MSAVVLNALIIPFDKILPLTSNASDGTLLINLDYTIKSVNVRTNAVFPFYLKEGTYITDL